jgi:rod shape-determining protein MreB
MGVPSFLKGWGSVGIGIDLGTANSLVYREGVGIVVREPSVVAINQKTGKVVAIGKEAKDMLGRTPHHISAIRPLVHGVVSHFEATEELLAHFLRKALEGTHGLLGPRVVVGVPSGVTSVESRAVRDATKNAGAREVFVVEEPVAAAVGMHLPIQEAPAQMVVDIGGGTTDIALLALNGSVVSRNIPVAGDAFNGDIMHYVRDNFNLVIGETTAEEIKHRLTTFLSDEGEVLELAVRGRDTLTGLPKEVFMNDEDVRTALAEDVARILRVIRDSLEEASPVVIADIMNHGIHLTGGGALMRGLPELLSEELQLPVHVAQDPLTSVVRGAGIMVENPALYEELFVHDDALPAFEA